MTAEGTINELQQEVETLKRQLHQAQCNNGLLPTPDTLSPPIQTGKQPLDHLKHAQDNRDITTVLSPEKPSFPPSLSITHPLLLLADSALPLGSFAYSSGLESYLAHTKTQPTHTGSHPSSVESFYKFLALSISSLASTTLPYVLKAHKFPSLLEDLDNDMDASTPCTVARRASVAQGLALLGVWERAYKTSYQRPASADSKAGSNATAAVEALDAFSSALKDDPADAYLGCPANGHLAPLWGVVCVAMGVDIKQAGYVFMLNHAKAVLSAAVRASVMGPYQAQAVLASQGLQDMIVQRSRDHWETDPDDAGQNVPVIDLWVGRHELLYSRIFNS